MDKLIQQALEAKVFKLVQNVHEADRLARHAIRKAFEATRDLAKVSGEFSMFEEQSRGLQAFVLNMEQENGQAAV